MSFKKSNSIFPKSETLNYNDYLNRKKGITIINKKKSYGSKIQYFMSYNEFINILKTYFYYLSKNNISRVPTKTLNQSNNSVVLYNKIKQHCYTCNECSYYNNFCESSCEPLKRVLYPYGVNFDYYSSFTNNSNINFDLINKCNTKSKYSDKSNVILSCSREWYPVPIINKDKDCSNCKCNPCNCCDASNNININIDLSGNNIIGDLSGNHCCDASNNININIDLSGNNIIGDLSGNIIADLSGNICCDASSNTIINNNIINDDYSPTYNNPTDNSREANYNNTSNDNSTSNKTYNTNNNTTTTNDNSSNHHNSNSKSSNVTIHNHNNTIINGVCETDPIEDDEDSLCEKISLCGKTQAFFSDKQLIPSYKINNNLNYGTNNCNSHNNCNKSNYLFVNDNYNNPILSSKFKYNLTNVENKIDSLTDTVSNLVFKLDNLDNEPNKIKCTNIDDVEKKVDSLTITVSNILLKLDNFNNNPSGYSYSIQDKIDSLSKSVSNILIKLENSSKTLTFILMSGIFANIAVKTSDGTMQTDPEKVISDDGTEAVKFGTFVTATIKKQYDVSNELNKRVSNKKIVNEIITVYNTELNNAVNENKNIIFETDALALPEQITKPNVRLFNASSNNDLQKTSVIQRNKVASNEAIHVVVENKDENVEVVTSGDDTNYKSVYLQKNDNNTYNVEYRKYNDGVKTVLESFIELPDGYNAIFDGFSYVLGSLSGQFLDDNDKLALLIDDLYLNVGDEIIALNNKYALGLSSELQNEFTFDVYSNLSELLFKSSDPISITYSKLFNIISNSLEGLYKSVLNDKKQSSVIQQLQSNLDKLTNTSANILEVESELDTVADIRPEVTEYINRYGLPEGLVFDTQLLGEIIEELKENND